MSFGNQSPDSACPLVSFLDVETVRHLTTLLERCAVVPAVNQIEVHPYFAQREVQEFGSAHGILTQAWSPIGRITFYRDGSHGSTLEDPVIRR
jgi:diketogulonate reductase-like aldo/keto reductase